MPDLPQTNAEINIAVMKAVYGFRWYHAPTDPPNVHAYCFFPPEEACATWVPSDTPLVTVRNGLLVHAVDGNSVGYVYSQSMLQPIASTEHAWRVLRFLAGQHRLRLITTSDEPTPETPGRYAVGFTSKASGLPPIVRVEEHSFERAACRAALELCDWAEKAREREAGAKPPSGKETP